MRNVLLESPIEHLRSRLDGVREEGGVITARCPCHNRGNNRLTVEVADDGSVEFSCPARCSAEEILRALRLTAEEVAAKVPVSESQPERAKPKRARPPDVPVTTTLEAALAYVEHGWSVIPFRSRDKRPALSTWTPYTERLPTEEELRDWFDNGESTNIGIVTGSVSRLLVLDVDAAADVNGLELPATPIVRTGRAGGSHYYFQLPDGKTIRNSAKLKGRKLDVRADHGYVVGPPSIHPNGATYQWALSPENTPLAPPPAWLEKLLDERKTKRAEFDDIPDELSERFCIMVDEPEHKQLLAAWEGRRKPKTDQSRSGYDLMMAALCIHAGLTEQETASVLINYKHGKAKERGRDYIERTIGKARKGIEDRRAPRRERAITRRASTVAREQISWLWPGRIPLGKISIIDGDPDLGKTLVCLDLAARISRGDVMPDDSESIGPADVVIASAEDDLGDTLRPRLEAAGADLKRIVFVTGVTTNDGKVVPLSFPSSIDALREAIEETKAALTILDPLLAFVGGATDTHKDDSVRRGMLSPLKVVAEETRTAILAVRHLNKSQFGRAIHRGGGSIAIMAAVRSAMIVAPAPDDPELRVLAVSKANLASRAPALTYRISPLYEDPTVPRVNWEGTLDVSADELLVAQSEDKGAIDEAKDFLREILADGPVMATKVVRAATAQQTAEKTLRRAKKALGIRSDKMGSEGWYWRLP